MSQMETHIGKMIEVDMNGLSLKEWCKNYCQQNGINEIESYCETWIEQFNDEFSHENGYVIANDKVYQIIDDDEGNNEEDIFYVRQNPDGSINYVVQYYNGGCCFSEAIEYALDRMKE